MSGELNITALQALCLDYAALTGGGTTFWIEDLNGKVIVHSGGQRQGRTARSALMRARQVRYAACALGPAANNTVPFFARACQRELDHFFNDAPVSFASRTTSFSPRSVDEIAGLTHDLNNLLATITGNAELLEVVVADFPRGREQLARISRSSRLARLLVARLGGSGSYGERGSVDLASVVSQMIELTGARSKARVTLVLEPAAAAFVVDADLLSMEQLVLNLVTNALAAVGEDGLLEVQLSKRERSGCREVAICVCDNGVGMDEDTLLSLRDSNHGQALRRGQGLAVVRRIVADHDGSIAFDSAPGRGTRTEIVLPVNAFTGASAPSTGGDIGRSTDGANG